MKYGDSCIFSKWNLYFCPELNYENDDLRLKLNNLGLVSKDKSTEKHIIVLFWGQNWQYHLKNQIIRVARYRLWVWYTQAYGDTCQW